MKYIIDTANRTQINEVLNYGIEGITANPTMYKKNQENIYDFLRHYSSYNLNFLSGEVIGSEDEMLSQAEKIHQINKDIVIKINFSEYGLKVCHQLHKQGYKTAMTLIFTLNQAIAAVQAGADYLFPFIGRNDEYGSDGLNFIANVQNMIKLKHYPVKVIAASIKNLHQLEMIAQYGIDYAAIPYDLYKKSLHHPLTISGKEQFEKDWFEINQ